jgi:hypothetical protein
MPVWASRPRDGGLMEYEIEPVNVPLFGTVEKVHVGCRLVGMVLRDPTTSGVCPDGWVAYHRGGHAAESREEAIRHVLEHAEADPDFSIS